MTGVQTCALPISRPTPGTVVCGDASYGTFTSVTSGSENYSYATQSFTVPSAGYVTIEVNSSGTSISDPMLMVYTSFSPTNPTANFKVGDDDSGEGVMPKIACENYFNAGTYVIAATTYTSGGQTGTVSFTISGSGPVTILPTVSTSTASSVTSNSAVMGGNVTSDGGATVTARGVAWGTSSNPTSGTSMGSGTGSYSQTVSGLNPGTTYYYRAYATNSVGTVYGAQYSFATQSGPSNPTSISATFTSICNGGSTQLTANGAQGTVYWYTGGCGSSFLTTGNPITVSPSSSTTYYARNYSNGLFSPGCASIAISVVAQPTAPSLTKNPNVSEVCSGQLLTVSATSGSGGAGTVSDQYSYSTNNGSTWSSWSTSIPSFSAVVGTNLIRSRRTATASGCNESSHNQVSWNVVAQPTAPGLTKVPTAATVCVNQMLTVTTTAGSGGTGTIADEYRFSTNNGTNWSAWSSSVPSFSAVTGTNLIQSRRTATGTGCNESSYNQVSWNVVAQPTAPGLTKVPTAAMVCVNQMLTVTTTAGSGGTGTIADEYRFSTNNGTNWSAWSTSVPSFAAVSGTNLIQSRRTATGTGCNESSYTQVSWGVYQAFTSGTIATTGETICSGTSAVTTIGSTTPASGGDGTITYKWQANGNDIANSDAATYLPGVLTQTTTFTRWAKDETCNTGFTQSSGNWVVTVNPLLQYRTNQSGNWTTLTNWQQFNGSDWVAATSFPGQISNDCSSPLVTIQAGHQMEIQTGSNIIIPNLEIKATGKLTVKSGGKIFVQDQLQLEQNAAGAIVVE